MAYKIKRKVKKKKDIIEKIFNPKGYLVGKMKITHAPFVEETAHAQTSPMHGIYEHPKGKLFFKGVWEEGRFSIEKMKGIKLSKEAQIDMEQHLTDEYIGHYTD